MNRLITLLVALLLCAFSVAEAQNTVLRTDADVLDSRPRSGVFTTPMVPITAMTSGFRVQIRLDPNQVDDGRNSFDLQLYATLDGGLTRRAMGGQTWTGRVYDPDSPIAQDGMIIFGSFGPHWAEFQGGEAFAEIRVPRSMRVAIDFVQTDEGSQRTPVQVAALGLPATANLAPFDVSFVGDSTAATNSGTSVTTPARTDTAGNTLVALAGAQEFDSFTITGATDTGSNSYDETHAVNAAGSEFNASMFHSHGIAGTTNNQTTISFSASVSAIAATMEFADMADQAEEDEQSASGTSGDMDTASVTSSAGAMRVVMATISNHDDGEVTIDSAGWTERINDGDAMGTFPLLLAAYKVGAGSGETFEATPDNPGDNWIVIHVSFEEDGGGGGGPTAGAIYQNRQQQQQ